MKFRFDNRSDYECELAAVLLRSSGSFADEDLAIYYDELVSEYIVFCSEIEGCR